MPDPSLARFRRAVSAACVELDSRREEVNDLNVFPVADGDTGDNMTMTLRAVLDELDGMDGLPIDEIGRDELVSAVARAALLGARGNSGVILSQIVRGAAEELASRPGELVDPVLVSAALARAADAAYASVRDPAEGTMLSAVAAMAHRVARELAHMETRRLEAGTSEAEQDELLADVLEHALDAGREAVERGPDQLAALREAGVVDAGAYGLTVIVAGVVAALRGDERPRLDHQTAPVPVRLLHLPQHESSDYRYCTNFVVSGVGLESRSFIPELERGGDCVLVVGDDRTLRVHLHTDEPDRATAVFERAGEVSRFDVADMREQVADRRARLDGADAGDQDGAETSQARCGVVAVVTGPGLVRLLEDLGALVVDGGASMNPSTYELLAGIHAVAAEEVVLLPNSPNVILAAERAAELSERPVEVVPTRSPQAGLSLLVGLDPHVSAEDNAAALRQGVPRVRTGGVARSARDDAQGRFGAGDALGYVDEGLVAYGDPVTTLKRVIEQLAEGSELVTCIEGEGAPANRVEVEALAPAGAELEYHPGGQPAWWWLLSAE
ncbi:MAG: DAK2 domain-containing protein [Thermoleophilaceae bacterium]|nr:DAK2 domain-containing protein [Thermoleophilaceae bacterium]